MTDCAPSLLRCSTIPIAPRRRCRLQRQQTQLTTETGTPRSQAVTWATERDPSSSSMDTRMDETSTVQASISSGCPSARAGHGDDTDPRSQAGIHPDTSTWRHYLQSHSQQQSSGLPLYVDPRSQLRLASSIATSTVPAPSAAPTESIHAPIAYPRRPSQSLSLRKTSKASRSHPYVLRDHPHAHPHPYLPSFPKEHPVGQQSRDVTAITSGPFPAVPLHAPILKGIYPSIHAGSSSNTAADPWAAASTYIHSRSSSISSVSSELSSSSTNNSSAWSESVVSAPGLPPMTGMLQQQRVDIVGSNTSPLTRISSNQPSGTYHPATFLHPNDFTDSHYSNASYQVSTLGGLSQHNPALFHTSSNTTPSPDGIVPHPPPQQFLLAPLMPNAQNPNAVTSSSFLTAPDPISAKSHYVDNSGGGQLLTLAEAIKQASGSNATSSEKAKINFVHGW